MAAVNNYCFQLATLSVILLLMGVCEVDASATLVLHMQSFYNPGSRKYNGDCCDILCNPCDPTFRFALDRGNSDDNPEGYHYWAYTTRKFEDVSSRITFGTYINGVQNPIETRFLPRWPTVGVKLKVVVTDVDLWDNDELDKLIQPLNPTPARNVSVATWTSVTVPGIRHSSPTSLTFRYKLYCDANYYSSDCSVNCVASDSDTGGHYTCDPVTGNIICRPGWKTELTKCKTAACTQNSCQNGATCVERDSKPYTCMCMPHYTGHRCETLIIKSTTRSVVQSSSLSMSFSSTVQNSVVPNQTGSSDTWMFVAVGVIVAVVMIVLFAILLFFLSRRTSPTSSQTITVPVVQYQTSAPTQNQEDNLSYDSLTSTASHDMKQNQQNQLTELTGVSVIEDGQDVVYYNPTTKIASTPSPKINPLDTLEWPD